MKPKDKRHIIRIYPNGDPFGSGFCGSESEDAGVSWYYRGDVSPMPRWWWRREAYRVGAILRYE
jgi:hypothetical protein